MAFKMKGPSLYTSPLPQKKKETKRGEDPNKKGTGLVETKELTHEERLAEQKKVDNPKRTSGIDDTKKERKKEVFKRGTGLEI